MLPIGTYPAHATHVRLTYTKAGDPQIIVTFVIVGGPHDREQVTWAGFFSDRTFDRTIQSLRYCGWTGDDISDLTGIDTNDVDIVVEHNEYNGRITPRVSWVNQPGGGAGMSPAQAKAFGESIKSRIADMSRAEPEPTEEVPF